MRLGTRWGVGSPPPPAVPEEIRAAIAQAEATVGVQGTGASWTLTWLEGRPIATLDDGTTVTLADGVPHIDDGAESEDPDAW